jgi:hypothetical protein
MFERAAWGGDVPPFILTRFDNSSVKGGQDQIVSLIIYEWKDERLVGVVDNPDDLDVG